MLKFKDAVVSGSKITLKEPISQAEFSKFCKDLYGGGIPVFKPVGVFMTHNAKLVAPGKAEYKDIHSYEFFDNLRGYTPVEAVQLTGAYTKQGAPVDLDTTVKERKDFKERAAVATVSNDVIRVISAFSPSVNMDDIVQVFARTDLTDTPDIDINDTRKYDQFGFDSAETQVLKDRLRSYTDSRTGRIILPERVKVKYSEMNYYGYDTYHNKKEMHPMVLFDDEKEMLYREGNNSRVRTPIIICYRGTGEWDYERVKRTLFNPFVDKFIPFEHVRFNISDAVGINMAKFVAGSREIPLTYFRKVNEEALQKIITYYGEVE